MIHLVYPHKNKIKTPDVIGHKLFNYLTQFRPVTAYEWDEFRTIKPQPGDILIGHVCPAPFTIMRNSLNQPGWKRKIIIQPYNEDINQIGFLDQFIDHCDSFLAITGPYWFARINESPYQRWLPRMIHLDLAVDLKLFPKIKTKFNPPGQRKFLYIGNDTIYKNLNYLEDIVKLSKNLEVHTFGKVNKKRRFVNHGFIDFNNSEARSTIAQYDFMITVGYADANPTTIIESLAWGLIPICTPTSGYENFPGVINIPLNDPKTVLTRINELQMLPELELNKIQNQGAQILVEHFNWDRFLKQVSEEINRTNTPQIKKAQSKLKINFTQFFTYLLKAIVKKLFYSWWIS